MYAHLPNTRRRPPNSLPTTTSLRQDAFQESISPSRRSHDKSARYRGYLHIRTAQQEVSAMPETFLQDATPVEPVRNNEDGEDPHDLSYSPRHVPRASMVDSMVMSLDHFSNGASFSLYNDPTLQGGRYNTMGFSQRRRHTSSSSMSSEGDGADDRPWPQVVNPSSRANRRNSGNHPHRQQLPSIFGEDENSVRVKVSDAQCAPRTPKVASKPHTMNRQGSNGSVSSVDLSQLSQFQGRLGPAGNRRSRSFDFGSRRPIDDSTAGPDLHLHDVAIAGLESQSSPVEETFPSPLLARKNSTQSSRSLYTKDGRLAPINTSTIRNTNIDAPTAIPTMRSSPALSNAYHGFSAAPAIEPSSAPRPGFFRRVFGSSRNVTASGGSLGPSSYFRSSSHGRGTPVADEERSFFMPTSKLQKPARRVSTDIPLDKENQDAAGRKPSSFFRRRKKSVSINPAPTSGFTLNAPVSFADTRFGEPSPASSLRALMEPYLGSENKPPATMIEPLEKNAAVHPANSSSRLADRGLMQQALPNIGSEKEIPSKNGTRKLHITYARQGSMLRVPYRESFLADSSSIEEPSKTPVSASPLSVGHPPIIRSRSPIDSLHKIPSNQSSVTDTSSTRPDLLNRQWSQEAWAPPQAARGSASSNPQRKLQVSTSEPLLSTQSRSGSTNATKVVITASASDISEDYRSAPSTPLSVDFKGKENIRPPFLHVSHPSVSYVPTEEPKSKALKLFDNEDDLVEPGNASAWLGDAGSERELIRQAYMRLFDWTSLNILAAMRGLCDRIALRGETQQVDRMLDAFAQRWCECNTNHGFKSSDVVHTISYSILLLNTDLHLADIGQKMTRSQFVRNALPTIKRVAQAQDADEAVRASSPSGRVSALDTLSTPRTMSMDQDNGGPNFARPVSRLAREDSGDLEASGSTSGPLVEAPWTGSGKGWDIQVENVLKAFYTSISRQRLPLFGAANEAHAPPVSGGLLTMTSNILRRTPSTLSKAPSDTVRIRAGGDNKSLGARWATKGRSRPRLTPASGFGSSRTSLDEQSSAWSPSMSSTWSRASIGKTLTSISVDSLGSEATKPDYQSSIGFANALSQAIIREDQLDLCADDGIKAVPLLEDESLELCGAPWAKEGILKHKCHLDGVDKRSRDRNWTDSFAVIEKGWMRIFSFATNAKSMRLKAKNQRVGGVVGGGNWQDNAEEIWKFMLRHTIASSLPPPGYSKARPFVWALSLPTGAVHLFSAGTPDIVKEFVSTANYWSARLSKEPMMGGISNMEYGWSDVTINRALVASESQPILNRAIGPSPRPSTQLSMRSSIDYGTAGTFRLRLPGDKIHINDWIPPQQSMMASQLLEVDQLKGLETYVKNVEEDLQKHNELRAPMLVAFSSRHPNSAKAMSNWEKKSSYLLREIVKFRTYIDILHSAQTSKAKIYKMRNEEEDSRRGEDGVGAGGDVL